MMKKLFTYEWKRYRLSIFIMVLCAVGCSVLSMLSYFSPFPMEFVSDILLWGVASLVYIPGVVYVMMSYTNDTGKKGLIFLTPCKPWAVILSKLLFGIAVTIFMAILMDALEIANTAVCEAAGKDSLGIIDLNDMPKELKKMLFNLLEALMDMLSTSIMLISALALAKFSAKTGSVQGVLTVVYYLLISLIHSFLAWLLLYFFPNQDFWDIFSRTTPIQIAVTLLFIIGGYFLTTFLTTKKINLA